MGIVNALKTGDVRLDMMIAVLIPVVMSFGLGLLSKINTFLNWEALVNWWRRRSQHKYKRTIVYRAQRNSWGGSTSLESDTKNTVLLKAIQLYLHMKVHLDLPMANINLTSMEDSTIGDYYQGDGGEDDENGTSKTLVGTLSKYQIVKKPPENQWHRIGPFGKPAAMVQLWISENEENIVGKESDGKAHCTTTFEFASSGSTAIDSFIQTAYQWYMDELRKMEDNSRYLYELRAMKKTSGRFGGGGGDEGETADDAPVLYSRYKLSEEKTFNSLFFRQKESLITSIDHFQSKSGKYAIPGYPHKLGLLLHGPPGTGKTSVIKALAQYTGRSIVNVPLTRISTNSELMDIIFAKKYQVRGEDVSIKLGFMDVIFVLEDVDAASKVVRRRIDKTTGYVAPKERAQLPQHKSTWQILLESNSPECRELVTLLMQKSDRLRIAALDSNVLESIARRMAAVPGLGLVGEGSEDEALVNVESEAVAKASEVITAMETVDRFIGAHAQTIHAMLEKDVEVNDAFVDELIGMTRRCAPHMVEQNKFAIRDPSYSSYDDVMEDALFEANGDVAMSTAPLPTDMDGLDAVKKTRKEPIGKETGMLPWNRPIIDQLNLTGLLNVLDGVVDTPGRILIMTTNHPEMLDPAIIRPGRIDKKLLLGFMRSADVILMLEHYFQSSLTVGQKQRLEHLIGEQGFNLTPAQVEQMTAEHDEVEDMIHSLEDRSRFRSHRRGSFQRKNDDGQTPNAKRMERLEENLQQF